MAWSRQRLLRFRYRLLIDPAIPLAPVIVDVKKDEWAAFRGCPVTKAHTEEDLKVFFSVNAAHWVNDQWDWSGEPFKLRDFRRDPNTPMTKAEREELEELIALT